MDAWLTRLLAPKPARHGTMIWWQGENAAAELCEALKERNIFVRYFNKPGIDNYLRITIGTDEQMQALEAALKEILPQA